MQVEIKNRQTGDVIISGEYESIRDCLEKNRDEGLRGTYLGNADLIGADLEGAHLRGTDLRDAYLRDADLGGAYLRDADLGGVYLGGVYLEGAHLEGAKGYSMSHDFAIELIRRHEIKDFTDKEWAVIGKIVIHRLCWEDIKPFGKVALSIFKKLEEDGFGEYIKKFKEPA